MLRYTRRPAACRWLIARGQRSWARMSIASFCIAGTAGAVVIAALAPKIVDLLLGPGYEPAVDILRALTLVLPLLGLSGPLAQHWMLPLGLERPLSRVWITAGIAHLMIVIPLAHAFGPLGVAWALVVTEAHILIRIWSALSSKDLSPFAEAVRGQRIGHARHGVEG